MLNSRQIIASHTTPALRPRFSAHQTLCSNILTPPRYPSLSQSRSLNIFAEFTKSVKRQIAENKDFQKNVKALGDEKTRLEGSDAMLRAKQALESSAKGTGVVMKHVKSAASTVGSAVEAGINTKVVQETFKGVNYVAEKTAETVEAIADPILDTAAAKKIASGVKTIKKEIIDTSTTARYSEYKPKTQRDAEKLEKEREALLQGPFDATKRIGPMSANPDAGEALVLHKKSAWSEKWESYKSTSHFFRGVNSIKQGVNESENPTVERIRDFFGRWSEETEEAKVIRMFKMADPSFTTHSFVKEATEDYIPEIMEAYLKGDMKTLSIWCSEPLCAQFGAGIQAQKTQGLISHSTLLDIRKVELIQTKLLDDDIPMLFIDFNTQENLLFKNKKGEIVLGHEDRIEHVRYRAVFTKDQCIDPTVAVNPVTKGYRCQECVRIDSWEGF